MWTKSTDPGREGYLPGGTIQDTNDSDAESDDSDGQGIFSQGPESAAISAYEFPAKLGRQRQLRKRLTPTPGGAFSALTPSMVPQEIMIKYGQGETAEAEDPEGEFGYRYDEFGFRVEEEDGPEQSSNKLLSQPLIEDTSHRLRWEAYLEFTLNQDVGALSWDKIDACLPRSDKLKKMIVEGIPHSLRPQIWMRTSGALQKKQHSDVTYKDIVKNSSHEHLMTSKQIEKDLLRTMPSNVCFSSFNSNGVSRLRRILRGLAWLYPDIGYCQGTGMIAASLLLFLEEEDAFWMMCALVEDLVPASYFSSTLIGVQADQRVLRQLLVNYLPDCDAVLKDHDIELSLICLHWFLTAFASVVHMKVLLRVWDIFFYEGSVALFRITLGMFKIRETDLTSCDNSAHIFNCLSDIPGDITDVDLLIEEAVRTAGSLSSAAIETQRRKHLAYLMADHGALINPESSQNLPKQMLHRRTSGRNRSVFGSLFWGEDEDESLDSIKNKNIRQTELLVDMREAILQVARHFQSVDSRYSHVSLSADYTMESHSLDHEKYAAVTRGRRRRAKALLDFERHDDDELGFRKNDVITVISQKDEHCWVGELNGLRGWFPAKFVELLDERSKLYTSAGDDTVTETITDLVRGTLCPALKAIFEHGLKKSSIIGGVCHPWLFVEEAAHKEVEKDFNSVYSRLVLCKTYRLDEDGKVLTPEELLYRSIQSVNQSHDAAHAMMDVKFRSMVCLGLNEQVLHLWLENLCSSLAIVERWYQPWSFLRSPGWVQIKCELRILSNFAFNLQQDWELPIKKDRNNPLKEGVRDMLVKHHLFSWDL